jgi:hypothetical protein
MKIGAARSHVKDELLNEVGVEDDDAWESEDDQERGNNFRRLHVHPTSPTMIFLPSFPSAQRAPSVLVVNTAGSALSILHRRIHHADLIAHVPK